MKIFNKILAIFISYVLTFLPLSAANIQVDGSTHTTLDAAQNGVPIVNIANPNSSGLSHNKYTNYNVTNQGVILNNSVDTTVNTQLGGYIYGNSNLTSNAKVILNEVTSTNRSTLGGYTEVAGQKADLVIANPNGITINGAGFINTSNVTLTTGSPIINNGQLNSFNIQGGDISIQGDGLDASQQDSAHIYTHYLQINAAIHAKDLDIKLGNNNIDYTSKEITSHSNSGTTTLLLDSSALGGMYANRISLVGTDSGIGVNLPPEVLASSGDITITNDGTIKLQQLTANNIVVTSNKDINLNNNAYALDSTKLQASGDITINSGTIATTNSLDITSKNFTNQATIIAGVNQDSTLNSNGLLNINSDSIINNGSIASTDTLTIKSNSLTNNNAKSILGLNSLSINATSSIDNSGNLQSNKNLDITTQQLSNKNTVTAKDMIINSTNMDNMGTLSADNSLSIASTDIINTKTISSLNSLSINAINSLNNNNGNILANNSIDILSSNILTNEFGMIKSNGDNKITATNYIDNINGNIQSNNDLNIQTKTIDLTSSNIYANHDLDLQLTTLSNLASSSIQAGNNLNINATTFITNDSDLLAGGSLYLTTNGDITNNKKISSLNDLHVSANNLQNSLNSSINAGVGISSINVANQITNNSAISAVGDLYITSNNIDNNGYFNSNNDLSISATNLTNNTTLFSSNDMNLYITNSLINNQNANIIALNNLKMAANSANAKTATIQNNSATIQTLNGNIEIYANDFNNIATIQPTKYSDPSTLTSDTIYSPGNWRSLETITTTIEHIDKTGYVPASLLSGGNLQIDSNTLNQYSTISATGNINLSGSLDNQSKLEAYEIVNTHGYVQHCDSNSWPKSGCSWYHKYDTDDTTNTLLDTTASTIQAGGSITGNVSFLNNGNVNSNQAISSSSVQTQTATAQGSNISTTDISLNKQNNLNIEIPKDNYGLFVLNQASSAKYLIEANPAFTVYNNFISSDYLLSHVDYSAEATTKRLGDALYENTLIRESILDQTGQRFLSSDITSDNEQYQYLMNNAIKASSDLKLTPGIALSQAQINALTSDIVWMEEKVVQGQKVLVPVVYIANANDFKLEGSRIIAANDINLNTANLKNAGSINAGGNLAITASDSIANFGGILSANKDINLQAVNDITNTSGTIKADNININSTNGNINNERFAQAVTVLSDNSQEDKTLIGASGQITATNNLTINANKDVTVSGSDLNAKSLNIDAQNVNITTTENKRDFFGGGSSAYVKENSLTNLASNLNADAININAKDTTTLKGSTLNATGDININADKLDVLAVNNMDYRESHASSKGLLSSTSSLDASLHENVQGTTIKANNISLNTQNDINLESVNMNANNSATINSQNGNINLTAKSYTNTELHEKSSSSFGGLIGSSSIDSLSQTKLGGSTTTAQNNIVVGGKNINIVANDLQAQNGDIKLAADENINIASGMEEKSEQHLKESTGLSFGLSGSKLTYAQKTKDSSVNTSLTNKASNINANNLVLQSGQDINLIASNIDANTLKVDTTRDFNVLSDKNVNANNQEHSKQDIGLEVTLNTKEASLFTGYWENDNGKTTTNNSVAKSDISAGTMDVNSKNTNIVGSDISANDITINSDTTRILSDTANTNMDTYTKNIKAGISVGVKQNLSNAVDAVENQGKAKSNTAIASGVLKTYDAVTSFLQKPVEAGVSAIFEQSSTNTNDNADQVVSSNLYAANSITLNSLDDLEVAGSNIYSDNILHVNAKNIDLHSSTQNYLQSTSSSFRNANLGLYGTNMGDLTLGFQDNKLDIVGTQQINSHLYAANKATLTSQENTTLKGAIVDANDLEVNVGKDLVMQSMQDTKTINGSSSGGSISENLITLIPSGISANTGSTKGDKKWVNEVTSLNGGESLHVSVNSQTTLTGASITNVDKNGNDQANLKLSTKTLELQNIHDSDTYDSTTMGIGIGSTNNKPKLNTIDYTNNTKNKEQIVRATVGKGEIVTDSDIAALNRDTAKIKEITKDESSNIELYASNNSLNALMDPVKAYNDTKQKSQDVGLAAHKEVLENIPTAKKIDANIVDNTIGKVLDGVSFTGLLPSQENGGGYVTQIATQLFGDNRNVLQTTDESKLIALGLDKNKGDYLQTTINEKTVYVTNPDKTIRITQDARKDGNLDDMKLYISEADAKEMGIDHLFTNGIMNSVPEALANQQEQQGNPSIGMLNYNQTHGLAGDTLEMTQEKLAVTTNLAQLASGSARQTGDIKTQLTQLNNGNLNTAAHSQGTMQDYLGTKLNQETIATIVQDNPNAKYTTQYSGSPVSSDAASELMSDIYGGENSINERYKNRLGTENVFKSQVNPGDFIGLLGGNFGGINNNAPITSGDFWDQAGYTITRGVPTLMNGSLQNNQSDPTKTSPHSGYPCVIGCGDNGATPNDLKFYFDPSTQKDTPLFQYYKTINVDPSKAKFNTGSN